jgi:hypothetical protein
MKLKLPNVNDKNATLLDVSREATWWEELSLGQQWGGWEFMNNSCMVRVEKREFDENFSTHMPQ